MSSPNDNKHNAMPPTSPFENQLTSLRIATANARDSAIEKGIQDLLALVRDHLGMDVVFVSEFVEGFREVRHGVAGDVPAPIRTAITKRSDPTPLEQTLCQRLIDGRLPSVVNNLPAVRATQDLPDQGFPIGSYLGVPVLRYDGSLYGALCCLTLTPNHSFGELELKRLQMAARLIARLLQH
jgi:GAF domain-containing protein